MNPRRALSISIVLAAALSGALAGATAVRAQVAPPPAAARPPAPEPPSAAVQSVPESVLLSDEDQTAGEAPAANGVAEEGASQQPTVAPRQKVVQPWSPALVRYLSTTILLFGLGVMWIMGWLVVRRGITQGVLRLICVPLIVVAAVFLMVVGYDKDQLTPIVGLLGTIAGYLLGKTDSPSTPATGKRRRGDGESGSEGAEEIELEDEPPAPPAAPELT